MISGRGVPLDAVVADFIAGGAESVSPDAAPVHWDVIEGQGSLFHPAYAGVTLGLVHGSQPRCSGALPSSRSHPCARLPRLRASEPSRGGRGLSYRSEPDQPRGEMRRHQPQYRAGCTAHAGGCECGARLPVADPLRGLGLGGLVESCLAIPPYSPERLCRRIAAPEQVPRSEPSLPDAYCRGLRLAPPG